MGQQKWFHRGKIVGGKRQKRGEQRKEETKVMQEKGWEGYRKKGRKERKEAGAAKKVKRTDGVHKSAK